MSQMEQIKQLTRSRASSKSKLTIYTKFLNKISSESGMPPSETDIIELNERFAHLPGILDEFEKVQSDIEAIVNEDLFDDQLQERDSFQSNYYHAFSKSKQLLARYPIPNQTLDYPSPTINNSAHNSFEQSINGPKSVKLPPLKLEIFDGKPEHFPSFFESFQSFVHNNDNLTNISKFLYLKSSLSEEPLKVIGSLDVIDENYSTAISLLEKRYRNKQLMIHNHIKAIISFPLIPKESFSSLLQLLDETQTHYRSLKNLGLPINGWDSILIYIIVEKFPYATRKEWETEISHLNHDELPTYDMIIKFLEKRCRFLEKIEKQPRESSQFPFKSKIDCKSPKNKISQTHVLLKSIVCPMCKSNHHLYACRKFLNMTIEERLKEIKHLKVCSNCLRSGHALEDCKSSNCKICQQRHSTLLHSDTSTTLNNLTQLHSSEQILPTAQISISNGATSVFCTALLDSGSMKSYMTISLARKLKIKIRSTDVLISGINKSQSKVSRECYAYIKALHGNFSTKIYFLLLPEITQTLSAMNCSLTIPDNIILANSKFAQANNIDVLLGVDIFWQLIKPEQPLLRDYPHIINSELGYLISGSFANEISKTNTVNQCNLSLATVSKQLALFWEQETIKEKIPSLSQEEQLCESHFVATHSRSEDGRFIVQIPLKNLPHTLGDSRERTMKQFYALERKLDSDPQLKQLYSDFMKEYETLNHMYKINEKDTVSAPTYYMPHLPVIRENSITTKLRVVFNSSAKTTTGLSLNDFQLNGPVIQDDLFSILLRFRRFKFVLSSDCSKMYRCVLLYPSQHPLQRIIWRHSSMEPIQTYQLSTVTYGQKASSFLAIRCLFELAKGCEADHPEISFIIHKDMYCDDLLTSVDSLEKAEYIVNTISKIFKSGGFILRKWSSNEPKILNPICNQDISNKILEIGPNEVTHTLGLSFSPIQDQLQFNIKVPGTQSNVTKRIALSIISKIFDPLGLLSIFTISSKIFMQQLWLSKLSWDAPLTPALKEQWEYLTKNWNLLNQLRIPRHMMCSNPHTIELYGFSDASSKAYGACIYIRAVDANGNISVNLVCAKTKVAPLKTITIPRLELLAATLLSKLTNKVKEALYLPITRTLCWTDSTIVLSWIRVEPYHLQTFVSNRISQMQSLTNSADWRYIPSKTNPSDLLSRNVNFQKATCLDIWWRGPDFLSKPESQWPVFHAQENSVLPEVKLQCFATKTMPISYIFEKYSTIHKIKRIAALCLRLIRNCKLPKGSRVAGCLSLSEMQSGFILAAKLSQQQSFPNEVLLLAEGKPLDSKNPLLKLNPFFDFQTNLIRVGGRLSNSDFSIDKKFPIIIYSKHHLTKILFLSEHLRLLHAGPQHLLASIREKFWPIGGRSLARKIVRTCVTCFRAKPVLFKP